MGMSPGFLDLVGDLVRERLLRPGDGVLDIGMSELACQEEPAAIDRFLASVNAPPYAPHERAAAADGSYARALFERAGFRYAAVDYADFPDVLRLDLNTETLPAEHHGRYAFVANCGTSEHILNQWNVFKTIHDAAAPGAVMYHGVPGWGDFEHGIIEYSPKFFLGLALANDYEILRYWGWSDGEPKPLDPGRIRVTFSSRPIAERVWLHVLLRKRVDRPFAGLNDLSFRREWHTPQAMRFKRSRAGRVLQPLAFRVLKLGRWCADRIHAWAHG